MCHQVNRIDVAHTTTVIFTHRLHHFLGDAFTSMGPRIKNLVVSLFLGDHTTLVVLAELENFLIGDTNDFLF